MAQVGVLDTTVLCADLWSCHGALFRILELVRSATIRPALSVALVLEYEMALKRRAAELELRADDIDAVLDYLCCVGHHQLIHFLWRPLLRDPRDELVLERAVAAGCRYLVTHNLKDFGGAEQFGVKVLTPAEFIRAAGGRP